MLLAAEKLTFAMMCFNCVMLKTCKRKLKLRVFFQLTHCLSCHMRNHHVKNKKSLLTPQKELLMLTKQEVDIESYHSISKCQEL